jgi:hypothetical protein
MPISLFPVVPMSTIPPRVFWEKIIEISIQGTKSSSTKKQKPQSASDSGAEITAEDDSPEPEEVMMVEVTWLQLYLTYMLNKTLPKDVVEAQRIIRRSKAFMVVKRELYKKSIYEVLQRCVTPQEGQAIFHDIHVGVCGHHASSRAIATKAFRAGFYWLTIVEDTKDIIWRCEACQRFASRLHAPTAELQPIPLS